MTITLFSYYILVTKNYNSFQTIGGYGLYIYLSCDFFMIGCMLF